MNTSGPVATPPTRLLRAVDLGLTIVTAPIWLTVIGVAALAVVIDSHGPALFRQPRVGRHGHEFTMVKLRSMRTGHNPLLPENCEITRVGAFLRATSLDELPQLFNVLAGHMSLVGPRPMLVDQAHMLDASQRQRHAVRPGLTGLAQINGRNSITWPERIHFDRQWAAAPTLRRYLRIVLATFGALKRDDKTHERTQRDPFVSSLTAGKAS